MKVEFESSRERVACVVVLLAVVSAGVFGAVASMPTDALPVGVTTSYGDSMQPAIDGDALLFYYDNHSGVQEGDIIIWEERCMWTYAGGEHYISHRVVGTETKHGETAYYTQGDAHDEIDQRIYNCVGPVTDSEYVGTVFFVLDL